MAMWFLWGGGFSYYLWTVKKIIAGYLFEFPDSREMLLHKNSNFYEIEEAFDKGMITKENVGLIHKTYISVKNEERIKNS